MYTESYIQPMSRWYQPSNDSYHTVLAIGYLMDCQCATTPKHVIYWSDSMKQWHITPLPEFLRGMIALSPGGAPLPYEVSFQGKE